MTIRESSSPSPFSNAFILTGPTCSGKTAIALEIAERLGCEIVAVDSMTLYRGMDIGTAKPTRGERERVPHHLVDVLEPWESGTVAWWLGQAEAICRNITARGKRPLLVGGTPFYLKSLLHGLFPGPPADTNLRETFEKEALILGNDHLHARLASVDARTAARLHPNDLRRVIRALEVYQLTGLPISEWQQSWDSPAFASENSRPPAPIPAVALEISRDDLYNRINSRVDRMIEMGWVDEVRSLWEMEKPPGREAAQALGYREIREFLNGNGMTLEKTVELIRTRTRQFAKRQMTWLRNLHSCKPVRQDIPNLVAKIIICLQASSQMLKLTGAMEE